MTTFSYGQLTLAEWNFPNNPDDAIVDIAVPANAGQTIYSTGGTSALAFNVAGVTTRAAWATGWNGAAGTKTWEIQFSTTGYFNLEFSSKQQGSATGPRDFAIEYKIGAAGAWTPLGIAVVLTTGGWNGPTSFVLPVACENQPAVYIHWITTGTTAINGTVTAAGGASRIDNINISANDGNNHYRSIATGNWNQLTTWESSPDLITWSPAAFIPSKYSKTITVRSPHIVTINSNVSLDQTTIQASGAVNYNSGTLTINDGAGVDLQVDGFFTDGSATSVVWAGASPRWALGANGTYTKTEGTSAANWQNNYNGGISTIPATANWVIHKTPTTVTAPTLTTVNMFYPNLTIMNTSGGTWATSVGSTFTGSLGTATVKGTLDIGGVFGSAFGTVDFLDDNTNALPVQVQGDLKIRAGNNLRNNGTGFELYANMMVDGSASYSGVAARKYKFSGGATQTISGTGSLATFGIYQMQVTKTSNDINLSRPVKVDNNLDLQNGVINSTAVNLMVIEDNATVTNTSNASFVRGPVRKLGDEAFTFPVGKNTDYQALGISAGAVAGGIFWTEAFQNGCASDCNANTYVGPNGAWTTTSTGVNGSDPNVWYVSGAECGNAASACGSVCGGTDPSLHIGSNASVLGDAGAAYLAGGLGFWFPQTNVRAESPAINCTGYSNITLSFNYIEWGSGAVDDATLWYFDGSAWSLLFNLNKTPCCGGPCNGSRQGQWTAYSIVLPASANNNPNIKIGFNWTNNDDNVGEDPPIAVDDITLSTAGGGVDSYVAEYFHNNPQSTFNNVLNAPLNHISLCEYWNLTKESGTSPRNVTLTWDGNSCGVTNLASMTTANFNGSSWDDTGNPPGAGTTAAGTITSNPLTVFGPFTLASRDAQNPLPIELISFEAFQKQKSVDLKWVTSSEINNDFFTVQRTADGNNFENIAKVSGKGNSNTVQSYSTTDYNPLDGLSFYRLMQTDFNGQTFFSELVPVRFGNNYFNVTLASLQSSNQVILHVSSSSHEKVKVDIFDHLGRKVYSDISDPETPIVIQLNSFEKGIYLLKAQQGENFAVKKFLR